VKLRTEGLYAILDLDAWRARGVDPARDGVAESIAVAMLAGGATALQLRAKNESARVTLALLQRLLPVTAEHGVPLFGNDRADLALLGPTDGVHLGQDDLSLAEARRMAPSLLVGVSTHNEAQLRAALAEHPDYVAFGPVYGTTSKERPDPTVGRDGVCTAARLASEACVPLVVIGGIDPTRASELSLVGANWFAVISDLVSVRRGAPELSEIEARARAFATIRGKQPRETGRRAGS
jgi:thiamine-phosphate pyrophosphorylase